MADDTLCVFVHETGTADSRGVPALLTGEGAVVVPLPPPRLLDRGAELEAVVVPVPTSAERPIERIRVVVATEFVAVDGRSSALVLLLDHSSRASVDALELPGDSPTDVPGSGATALFDAMDRHGNDLWATLRELEPTVADRLVAADREILDRLPEAEHEQRVPAWFTHPEPPTDDTIRFGRGWWCHIWRCR